ncbi:MAG TPA: hypothetical protein VG895_01480 [Patescibacteria group bacterium]|nr:hypothetical protein [Patescibacteria group bacterium]
MSLKEITHPNLPRQLLAEDNVRHAEDKSTELFFQMIGRGLKQREVRKIARHVGLNERDPFGRDFFEFLD